MSAVNLKFVDVTFSYNTSIEPLFSSLNLHFSKRWTGIVGPNGAGKSTIAKLAAGILRPVSGSVINPDKSAALYCEQGTEELPENADVFIFDADSQSGRIRSMLGVDADWIDRWPTLSHGERKRFQIAVALWSEPDILILDEPINHVDGRTRQLLLTSLLTYKGTGIIVSHDRDFLDSLCRACLFLNPGDAVLRAGNFSEGFAQEQLEKASREKNYTIALSKYRDLNKRSVSLKNREKGKQGKLSKRNISKHDHDAKSKVDGARLTGKDKKGARSAAVLERRASQLKEAASSAYYKQRRVDGVSFQGERSRHDYLLRIREQSVRLGQTKELRIPEIEILPADRIAVTGGNGAGKSTLISMIIPLLNLKPEQILYIPQEIDSELWTRVEYEIKNLDSGELGMMYSSVHRLGSEPDRVMYSEVPSPGEKRKMMLAVGLLRNPAIIIMDEPTNHMDLMSIQCIEEALGEFKGALIIVSHDPAFIKMTTEIEWKISQHDRDTELTVNPG